MAKTVTAVLLLILSPTIALAFSGPGSGTAADPYRITTCTELQEMAGALGADYVLVSDIDCSETRAWNGGAGFVPVGGELPFIGTFDGRGHTIRGLYINRPGYPDGYDVGLCGWADGASLRNVTLEDFEIIGYTNVGSLAGSFFGTPQAESDVSAVTVLNPSIQGGR